MTPNEMQQQVRTDIVDMTAMVQAAIEKCEGRLHGYWLRQYLVAFNGTKDAHDDFYARRRASE